MRPIDNHGAQIGQQINVVGSVIFAQPSPSSSPPLEPTASCTLVSLGRIQMTCERLIGREEDLRRLDMAWAASACVLRAWSPQGSD